MLELRERKKEKKKEPDSGEDEKPQQKEKDQNKGTDAESSVVEGKDSADKVKKLFGFICFVTI